MNLITNFLFNKQDEKYKIFSEKLIPDTKLEIIGVRVPDLKCIAKTLVKDYRELSAKFIDSYNHKYYEEWFLHGLLLKSIQNIDELTIRLDKFLPHVDNWAICDSTAAALKLLVKHPQKTLENICVWLKSKNPYTTRFAIVLLNNYYLDEHFKDEYLKLVSEVVSDNYYVNMAKAWFFSTALIKQYQKTVMILQNKVLDKFVHNKAIQKAIESYRIENDKKLYLKTLKTV